MLDPDDWDGMRQQGHRMLDDMFDHLQNIREQPVWQPAPQHSQQQMQTALNPEPIALDALHQDFMQHILPYCVGNTHPGFMGWVHGGGTPVGMLAEMLAAGLNANVGGRNQMALDVECQVIDWMRDAFSFPQSSSGVLTTGTSAATLIALTVARSRIHKGQPFAVYVSQQTHGCIARALRIMGIDTTHIRIIPCTPQLTMDAQALQQRIHDDKQQGIQPWLLVGTAGSVHTGSIDNLSQLADIAQASSMWLHVDGALGAIGILSSKIAPHLRGIEHADSLAMDFHKWGQVPYDAGMVLVRDGDAHRHCFATTDAYLQREDEGLAAHSPWPCDYGIDLSRSFRALKIWFTLKHFGSKRLGAMMEHSCSMAQLLASEIQKLPHFTLMAEVPLNIVCFRYVGTSCDDEACDAINRAIIRHVQLSGLAAPSLTYLHGRAVIRTALVNHRTQPEDIGKLLASLQQAIDSLNL